MVGWTNYYALADTPSVFEGLDEWLRRRLRQVRWKEWKRPKTKRRRLIALGIRAREATEWSYSRKGYWRVSGSPILTRALPNAYWDQQGLKGFTDPYRRFRDAKRTAGCGSARPVVWEAPGCSPAPTRSIDASELAPNTHQPAPPQRSALG